MNDALSMPLITEAGVEAIDPIMSIMEEAFDPGFGEAWTKAQCLGIFGLPSVWLTLAVCGDRPAGFTLARIIADEAELLLIAVAPQMHRRGIGMMLLENVLRKASSCGATRVHLEVRDGNEALNLYQRSGFSQVGRRPAYYRGKFGQSFDALTLSRSINPI
jgi:ribosomal-protein-alanine N-acetyltransferase